MTEDEVNVAVRRWLEANGWHYKGILRNGQVPVPIEGAKVLIDHQGEFISNQLDSVGMCSAHLSSVAPSRLWVEAKGSGHPLSEYLEGFIRIAFAIYYGGGDGLLAIPHKEFDDLREIEEFLVQISKVFKSKGRLGLLDAEREEVIRL